MKPIKFVILSALILLTGLGSFASHARHRGGASGGKGGYSIYAENDEAAHSGRCIYPSDDGYLAILSRNGITYSGSYSESELKALAKGIAQVERLNGGPLPADWRTRFNFQNRGGSWNQHADAINVHKLLFGGDNVAALMHEFGHKIGNADKGRILSKYLSATKSCAISSYARTKRSEEFGEVFSAFIVNPDDLKSKCPGSYAALKEIFKRGESGSEMASCSTTNRMLAEKASKKPGSAVAAEAPVSR